MTEIELLRASILDDVAKFALADWYEDNNRGEDAKKIRDTLPGFVKKITYAAAWDRTNPYPKKNYGIHGVECRWTLTGPKGAVQFLIYTNWHLPHVQERLERDAVSRGMNEFMFSLFRPSGADVGYHSPKPMHAGQEIMQEDCPMLGGRPCYYDGSGLAGERMMTTLIEKGDDAVWQGLKEYYQSIFDGE